MGIFAIEKGAFAALSADDQAVVREVMTKYIKGLDDAARADNERANDTLLKSGVQSVAVEAANVDTWRTEIAALFPRLRERPDMDAALFDEMLGILADYRRAHP
jgi:TRAP-type C4-dicarboxylate transport system substrate-binding protein